MRYLIGKGILSWGPVERRSDRYGTVNLSDGSIEGPPQTLDHHELEGKKGKLIAKAVVVSKSPHCGDLARGIYPSTPAINEEIELGEGELFFEHFGDAPHEKGQTELEDDQMMNALFSELSKFANEMSSDGVPVKVTIPKKTKAVSPVYDIVGLKPEDGRKTDWMNPRKLYRAIHQTVELYFEIEE